MKRYMLYLMTAFILIFCFSSDANSKIVEINASVENISFGTDREGCPAVYFTLKESEYANTGLLKGESVKFLVNVADENNYSKRGNTLFWVLFIIEDYFSGKRSFATTPFVVKVDMQKREIKNFIFVS